ncbi:MAG: hypothetical protein ACK4F7_08170 [Inhella sp.]
MNSHCKVGALRARIDRALQVAGAGGMLACELQMALPGVGRTTLFGSLSRMRAAGQCYCINAHPVSIHYHPSVPMEQAQASFAQREPVRRAEVALAMQIGHQQSPKRPGRPAHATATTAPKLRRRAEHLRANRITGVIKGDGTHEPAKPLSQPPTVEPVDPAKVQHCRGWTPRWAVTEPIQSLPIGQYDTPPSRWALAALDGAG